jgi:thiol:disulfide interchange protein
MTAGFIFILDVFFMDQGILTLVVGLGGILVLLIGAGIASVRHKRLVKHRLFKAGIFALMIAAVFGARSFNYKVGNAHLRQITDACNQYRVKYKRFPDKLQDLAPEFIQKIPKVKYVFNYWNEFNYINHTIIWVVFPPFARMGYNLDTDILSRFPD